MTPQEWYKKNKGKYVNKYGGYSSYVQDKEPYSGQCASLGLDYIASAFGYARRSYGDGADYLHIPGGKRLSKPKDWCLIVWPRQQGLPWGHVAIYYKGKMISQNPNKIKLMTIWSGKKYYIEPRQNQGGIKVIKAEQLLTNNGRIALPADRAMYDKIPTKATKFKKVLKKGSYPYNGLYLIKDYKGVDSQGRKCHFTRVYDNNGNKFLGFIPIYDTDKLYRTKQELIKLP